MLLSLHRLGLPVCSRYSGGRTRHPSLKLGVYIATLTHGWSLSVFTIDAQKLLYSLADFVALDQLCRVRRLSMVSLVFGDLILELTSPYNRGRGGGALGEEARLESAAVILLTGRV